MSERDINDLKASFRLDAHPAMRELNEAATAVNDFIEAAARAKAAEREKIARRLVLASLPRGLRWIVDHPRLLRVFYRVRPGRRPVMVERVGDG